ncbi:MAG: MSMEG_4193 family putative phosphomutase [Acidimicrobiales bacterium]
MVTPASLRGPRPGRARAAPSTLVLLVRHGSTPSTGQVLPGRAAGLHLADSGREQAERLASRLAEWAPPSADGSRTGGRRRRHVHAVYASPMERTKETAQPIASALGLPVRTVRGLVECDFGDWTGANLKDLAKRPEWATVQRYPSGFRFPGGESFAGMQARMVDTIAGLCLRHRGEAIVAVSHADPIKAAVAEALGTHLDLFQRILISPCSVTAISYGPLGPSVLAVNSTGALGEGVPW